MTAYLGEGLAGLGPIEFLKFVQNQAVGTGLEIQELLYLVLGLNKLLPKMILTSKLACNFDTFILELNQVGLGLPANY